jgi:rRNA-processing protein FCF1
MAGQSTIVVDANSLLNLATARVDASDRAPTGADPLKTLLASYDVHVPDVVMEEIGAAAVGDDLLAAAADLVLQAAHHLTTHDVEAALDAPLTYGLDTGESHALWLTNDLQAAMFLTDEFNTTTYLLVSLGLDDRNTLFTTSHVLCSLADDGSLSTGYVDAALTYFVETKHWDRAYVEQLRSEYL